MTDRGMEEQASLYVLDLLSGEELEAFEKRLHGSTDLRRLVRELRKGTFQYARQVEQPVRMDLLDGIHQRLGIHSPAQISSEIRSKVSPFPWSFAWGAAAILFFCMNLLLLFILGQKTSVDASSLLSQSESETAADGLVIEDSESLSAEDTMLLRAHIQRLREALSNRDKDLSTRDSTLDSLISENEEIRAYNAGWQREYTRLAARFLPFFESNDGMSRFTVIEMVDAEAYAQQAPRRGFADLAGSFLEGEGNIAGVGDIAFVGPIASGVGIQTANLGEESPGLTPSVRGESRTVLPGAFADSADLAYEEVEIVTSPTIVETGEPAGFTVWRDDEQKGFLDLYNLPEPAQGEAAFLWVRASEYEPYIGVGFVPELENGTGSLFYEVDEPNFTPTEILITGENEGQPGEVPSGNILLRGP